MKAPNSLRRPFLPVVGTIAAVCCLLALLLAVIDPFDIYPWGIRPKLKTNGDYSPDSTRFLAAVVAKTPSFDTILLGGSTSRPYTPQMMAESLPNTRSAFNFSYSSPSPPDRVAVLGQLLRFSHARRLILEADWSYILPKATRHATPGFPIYLYDGIWWNDVRGMSKEAFQLSWVAMHGDALWLPAWSRDAELRGDRERYEVMHSEASQVELRTSIARNRASINTPSQLTCRAMDAISEDLIPFASAFSARGVEVDVVLPPYSWLFYYWVTDVDTHGLIGPSMFSDVLQMRRCLVQAAGALPRIRIFSFDNVPGLASDWKNYFDPAHLYNSEANRYILRSIAQGKHVLSASNIDADTDQLRASVVGYRFTSEKQWTPEQ